MSRHRATRQPSRQARDMPQQLPLVAPVAKLRPRNVDPEAVAKIAIQRRAKPSAVPGQVRLVLTLDLPRELAERLSAKSVRDGTTFEAIVIERLKAGVPDVRRPGSLRRGPPAVRELRRRSQGAEPVNKSKTPGA